MMKVLKRVSLFTLSVIAASLNCSGAFADNQAAPAASSQNPAGVVDGTNVNSFFGSGAVVDPMAMEQASVQADKDVNLGPDHKVKVIKQKDLEKEAHGGGFFGGVGRAIEHTGNFIGFPIGDDSIDHGVDASLSSDMQNEKNRATNNRLKEQFIQQEKAEKAAKEAAKQAEKQSDKSTTSAPPVTPVSSSPATSAPSN